MQFRNLNLLNGVEISTLRNTDKTPDNQERVFKKMWKKKKTQMHFNYSIKA